MPHNPSYSSNSLEIFSQLRAIRTELREQLATQQPNSATSVALECKTLLAYATRLSKFSQAPPGYVAENPEASNAPIHTPWPGEDSMRRGALAASISHMRQESQVQSAAPSNSIDPKVNPISDQETPDAINDPTNRPMLDLDLYQP